MATAVALAPAVAACPSAQSAAAVAPASTIAADPSAGDGASGAAPLVVEGISPEAVGARSTITVTGRITNTTERPLSDVTVRFRYSAAAFGSRTELAAYAEGEGGAPQSFGPTVKLEEDLAPGASAEYELEVEAEKLGLHGFGVYPLAVDAVDGAGSRVGIQYTFLPYTAGAKDVDPVRIAWIWPLMDHPQRADDDTFLDGDLAEDVAADGRLDRLLWAGAQTGDPRQAGRPGEPDAEPTAKPAPSDDAVPITWAVDPGLLDDVERLAAEGGYQVMPDPESADSADSADVLEDREASTEAQTWLGQARAIVGDDDAHVIATPYADADLPALIDADLDKDAEAALTIGDETVQRVLGRSADPAFAWPAGGLMNNPTRDLLAEHGATSFVLSDSAMPAQPYVTHTPSAAAPLPLPDGADGTALLTDGALTRALDADSWAPGAATLAQQRFVAETALIAAEQPGGSRTLVVTPPRDWDPSPELAQGLLEATDSLSWLDPVALDGIDADNDAAAERRGLTYPDRSANSQLTGPHLDQLRAIRRDVRLFNSVLTEDDDPFRPAVLRLESAAWRDEEALAARIRGRVATAVEETTGMVRIMPGEPVTLASKSGTLGILVANDLPDHSVTVRLSIFSENSERLSVGDEPEIMEIGPGGKTTVYVPISARINGRTVLHMSLHNSRGEPISAEETMTPVNVTGLGTTALLISGASALVLIVALAPRALRKWARRRAEAAGAAPEAGEASEHAADGGADSAPYQAATIIVAGRDGAPDRMQQNGSGPSGERPNGPTESTGGDAAGPTGAGRPGEPVGADTDQGRTDGDAAGGSRS
ncbi:DUF6049 family protein [Marinitenerispora sediminis]|uniref:DUF6049 family protein n=1 Tax=Marinitenerispora sediminis TaxID=1931232 RepID=UPI0011C045F3|nr:DUF6049 family protein [Marinitenerispora sediminis]